jgi:hypothetical protein
MMRQRKAVSTWDMVLAVVLVLILAFVGYKLIMNPAGMLQSTTKSVDSCIDPLSGKGGACDCIFNAVCPADTKPVINHNCPRVTSCTPEEIATGAVKAQKEFDAEVKSLQSSLGAVSTDTVKIIEMKHFGYCCTGAKMPEVART